jgi:hypothetical protein
MMQQVDRPKAPRAAHSRARSLVTTLVMIGLAIMIVRDIVARRFGAMAAHTPDVTQRSR